MKKKTKNDDNPISAIMEGAGKIGAAMLKGMKESGAHICKISPMDKNEKPLALIMVIESPSQQEIDDIKALENKWEEEDE